MSSNDIISTELEEETLSSLIKPSEENEFSEFTKSCFWSGSTSWWKLDYTKQKQVLEQKALYLNKLIETLN